MGPLFSQETNGVDTPQPVLVSYGCQEPFIPNSEEKKRANYGTDFSNEQVDNSSSFVKTAVDRTYQWLTERRTEKGESS
jgi:hypothetical protein